MGKSMMLDITPERQPEWPTIKLNTGDQVEFWTDADWCDATILGGWEERLANMGRDQRHERKILPRHQFCFRGLLENLEEE